MPQVLQHQKSWSDSLAGSIPFSGHPNRPSPTLFLAVVAVVLLQVFPLRGLLLALLLVHQGLQVQAYNQLLSEIKLSTIVICYITIIIHHFCPEKNEKSLNSGNFPICNERNPSLAQRIAEFGTEKPLQEKKSFAGKAIKYKNELHPSMVGEETGLYRGDIFSRLAQSKFRSSFSLSANDLVYVREIAQRATATCCRGGWKSGMESQKEGD